jgi:hypothetical protein
MNYDDYCRNQVKAISPIIRPSEDPVIPPPLYLTPATETADRTEKESEPLLAVLIQQNYKQTQEIKALKEELRELRLMYEELLGQQGSPLQHQGSLVARKNSILDQALAIRSRSSSFVEPVPELK